MKNIFAEFISPYVSQIHQSDPTINFVHFSNTNSINQSKINNLSEMSEEVFSLFESISKGNSIELDKEQCFQLKVISILLKNEEMFTKLDELFEEEEEDKFEKKINGKLDFDSFLEMNSGSAEMWYKSKAIEDIASNLYSICEGQIIGLPRTVFYSILTNSKLTIESEDWLLDLIDKFTSKEKEEEEKCQFSMNDGLSDIYFYEEVNFDFLSEDKLKEFIEKVDPNEITAPLWDKIKRCFYFSMKESPQISFESSKREGNGFYRHTKRYAKNIVVGGDDEYRQIGENPTSKNKDGDAVIYPPQNLHLNPSSPLSYSACSGHSVSVTRSGSLIGVGHNNDGRISGSLEKAVISQFSEFSVNDSSGRPLNPVSAVCTQFGTLYMLTKSCGSGRQLAYCGNAINDGTPAFIMQLRSALAVKSSSSTVTQSQIRYRHASMLFLFLAARRRRWLPASTNQFLR